MRLMRLWGMANHAGNWVPQLNRQYGMIIPKPVIEKLAIKPKKCIKRLREAMDQPWLSTARLTVVVER